MASETIQRAWLIQLVDHHIIHQICTFHASAEWTWGEFVQGHGTVPSLAKDGLEDRPYSFG